MKTLNGIAENIAFALGQQFNDTLLEGIKDSIIDYRATFIRQDLERNQLSYTDYLQSFCIELEQVNKSECPGVALNEWILKSKEPVPKPLRLKNNGRVNFKYVGSVDRTKVLTFESGHGVNYMDYLPLQGSTIYYTVRNGYLYVLNNIRLCKLVIEEVVADPRDIKDCNNPTMFRDDIPFPIPTDMVAKIKELIKRDYPQYIKDGKEVKIEDNDRN